MTQNLNKGRKIKIFVFCLILVYLIGFLGSIFTSSETKSSWYLENKPKITPPNYIFPIVWNILFLLIAISIYLSWINSKNKKERTKIIILFGINLFLNFLWSFLFFGLKNPLMGFIDILLLFISILTLIFGIWKISKSASYLLIPYLLWVGFASILNYLFI
jgi:tryptophan-rich sensory protein